MKPYPRYKPIGLPWLDKIPAHWNVFRNKNFLHEKKSLVGDNASSYTLLSLTLNGIIARDMENPTGKFPSDFSTYKAVEPGDMVFCLFDMDETPRTVGLSNLAGMVTGAYDVFSVSGANSQFLYYYYLSIDNTKSLKPYYSGLRKVVPPSRFLGIPIPLPPPSEQDRIVRYLEEKTAAIDELVRAKEREIELLRERKQALVSAAVTGGLDPATERKDSGVPWIGKIPKEWKVCRLKDIVRSNLESLGESTAPDKQIEYLDISAVGNGYLREKPVRMVFGEAPSRARRIVHEGDTIISTVRTYLKSVLYIDQSVSDCIVSTGFSVLTPKKEIEPRYLGFLLSSNWFVDSVIAQSIGISYPAINDSSLLALPVAFPPLPEQERIVAHLDSACSELDAAEAAIRKQIALLQELRTRLVSDAVTGAVKVS